MKAVLFLVAVGVILAGAPASLAAQRQTGRATGLAVPPPRPVAADALALPTPTGKPTPNQGGGPKSDLVLTAVSLAKATMVGHDPRCTAVLISAKVEGASLPLSAYNSETVKHGVQITVALHGQVVKTVMLKDVDPSQLLLKNRTTGATPLAIPLDSASVPAGATPSVKVQLDPTNVLGSGTGNNTLGEQPCGCTK